MPLLTPYLSRARTRLVVDHLRGDVLDVGCQRGQLRDLAGDQVGRYVGIDLSADAIDAARAAHPDAEFHVIDVDAEDLPFESEFDTVVLVAVIEHVFDLAHLGHGLARALRPGGRVVLTTPTPFGNDVVHRLGARVGLFHQGAVDDHIAIFNRQRLRVLADEVGLRLVEHRRFQLGCNQVAVLEKPAA